MKLQIMYEGRDITNLLVLKSECTVPELVKIFGQLMKRKRITAMSLRRKARKRSDRSSPSIYGVLCAGCGIHMVKHAGCYQCPNCGKITGVS